MHAKSHLEWEFVLLVELHMASCSYGVEETQDAQG